jgi:hypothetical protein
VPILRSCASFRFNRSDVAVTGAEYVHVVGLAPARGLVWTRGVSGSILLCLPGAT